MKKIEELMELLWDVDIATLDQDQHRQFLIERILRYGNPKSIRWLLANYRDTEIIAVVKSGKNLDRKTANYWAIHYHIPKEEVLCLNRSYLQEEFY